MDPYTFILNNIGEDDSQPPGTLVYIDIVGNVLGVTPLTSFNLSLTLLCFVGVDGCTEQSTGFSSGGSHNTIISPIAESSTAGRHGDIIIFW